MFNLLKNSLVFLIFILLYNCTTYSYNVNSYKNIVTFQNPPAGISTRSFKFKKKIYWVAFDLASLEEFDLGRTLKEEFPSGNKIYNLKISSEEDVIDSLIRTLGTGIQYLLVSNRPLVSRRTIIITGEVVE